LDRMDGLPAQWGGSALASRSLLPASPPSAAQVRDAPRPGWGRGASKRFDRPIGGLTKAHGWDELVSIRRGSAW
jgi:hypothetical protein